MSRNPKGKLAAEHLAFRVDPEVLARLDRLAEAMTARHVVLAFTLSRSEAARAALLNGLAPLEREYGLAPLVEAPAVPFVDGRTGRRRKASNVVPLTSAKGRGGKGAKPPRK